MLDADDFWAFSCVHYGQSGVQEACLTLQNTHGFNVNMVLLCCYLQKQNVMFDRTLIETCLIAIEVTDEQLKRLRSIRTDIKSLNEKAYGDLLQAELALEQQQQQLLVEALNQHSLTSTTTLDNTMSYAQYLGLDKHEDVLSLLDTVNT